MGGRDSDDATMILGRLSSGDAAAAESLLPLVYEELRAVAGSLFRRQPDDHSLQPTALVHEAYLKLIRQADASFADETHFVAVAAIAMRQILVDHARARNARKRGGEGHRVTLDLALFPAGREDVDILALHSALEKLASIDERKARVIELRFFGGLDVEQAAKVLDVARSTVTQDWRFARAWLVDEIYGEQPG